MVKKLGRPSKFNKRLIQTLCERLALGESLRQICKDPSMPDRATVMRWMVKDESFATKCARARAMGTEVTLDELQEIEERTLSGQLNPKAANVVIASKQWRMAKLAPKKYGLKSSLELTGANGGAVQLSDSDRALKVAALLALAQARKEQQDEPGPV